MSKVNWEVTNKEREYLLKVTVESELRPHTIYEWVGNILIDHQGKANINQMMRDWVLEETRSQESPTIMIQKPPFDPGTIGESLAEIALECRRETQKNEKTLSEIIVVRELTNKTLAALVAEGNKEVKQE